MKIVRIKQCIFENASREKGKPTVIFKNGLVKFNMFFLKPHTTTILTTFLKLY